MTATLADFAEKFSLDQLTIRRTEHWTWSVRPFQPTIGCGVLSLNRLCPAFGGMTPEEGADLATAVALVEGRLGASWAPDRFNYLMFMLVDAHVHLHVVPRYATEREFGGRTWVDPGWPRPLEMAGGGDLPSPGELVAIRDALAS